MTSGRILIIEDDLLFSDQLATLLRNKGFNISQYQDGQEGLLAAMKETFDLILLDVLLPSMNGFMVLNQLRKASQTPVMMITACVAEEERIEGYQKGADDYLPKPFSFAEMMVRIEALLRRANWREPAQKKMILIADNLYLHRSSQKVRHADIDVVLTPIQFRLLWELVENRYEVLSKPYLYQAVLERSYSRYDRSLDMHLSRIRRKLLVAGMMPESFTTVHGKGYRFA